MTVTAKSLKAGVSKTCELVSTKFQLDTVIKSTSNKVGVRMCSALSPPAGICNVMSSTKFRPGSALVEESCANALVTLAELVVGGAEFVEVVLVVIPPPPTGELVSMEAAAQL